MDTGTDEAWIEAHPSGEVRFPGPQLAPALEAAETHLAAGNMSEATAFLYHDMLRVGGTGPKLLAAIEAAFPQSWRWAPRTMELLVANRTDKQGDRFTRESLYEAVRSFGAVSDLKAAVLVHEHHRNDTASVQATIVGLSVKVDVLLAEVLMASTAAGLRVGPDWELGVRGMLDPAHAEVIGEVRTISRFAAMGASLMPPGMKS